MMMSSASDLTLTETLQSPKKQKQQQKGLDWGKLLQKGLILVGLFHIFSCADTNHDVF